MVVFAEFDEFRKVKLRLDAERDTKRKENQRVAALNQGFPGKRELGANAYIIYASDPPLAAEYDQFGQIILKRDPGNFAEIRRRLKKSQED
jgi:hypothetical protein